MQHLRRRKASFMQQALKPPITKLAGVPRLLNLLVDPPATSHLCVANDLACAIAITDPTTWHWVTGGESPSPDQDTGQGSHGEHFYGAHILTPCTRFPYSLHAIVE